MVDGAWQRTFRRYDLRAQVSGPRLGRYRLPFPVANSSSFARPPVSRSNSNLVQCNADRRRRQHRHDTRYSLGLFLGHGTLGACGSEQISKRRLVASRWYIRRVGNPVEIFRSVSWPGHPALARPYPRKPVLASAVGPMDGWSYRCPCRKPAPLLERDP